jgi:tRNA A-37 threonylcarbamoyl transferase component Bud32
MNDFAVGQRLGDYEILDMLGAGGMGKVYKVKNVISERIEAMKIVLPDMAGQQERADRFLREIKLLAKLDHPNIAQLRTALTLENQLVMIMEFVEGVTFSTRLRQGPIPAAEACNYADQVLAALSYAHRQNIIHRDIKPANMMLTPQGIVKLMDFGLARSVEDGALTSTRTTMGSLYYMAPEQVRAIGHLFTGCIALRDGHRTPSFPVRQFLCAYGSASENGAAAPGRSTPGSSNRSEPDHSDGARKGPGKALSNSRRFPQRPEVGRRFRTCRVAQAGARKDRAPGSGCGRSHGHVPGRSQPDDRCGRCKPVSTGSNRPARCPATAAWPSNATREPHPLHRAWGSHRGGGACCRRPLCAAQNEDECKRERRGPVRAHAGCFDSLLGIFRGRRKPGHRWYAEPALLSFRD